MKFKILIILFCSLVQIAKSQKAVDYFLIIGTYTSGKSEGIYVYRYDTASADLRQVSIAKKIDNPSFLCTDPDGEYIYAVSEKNTGATPGGQVIAYQFVNPSGLMIEKKRISSQGNDPCFIAVHPDNQWFAAGNYSSGSLLTGATISSGKDFSATQLITHSGSGLNKDRQESPHVHATVFSPDGRYLLVPDLGIDKVNVYAFDKMTGKLTYQKGKSLSCDPGSGPRHLDFHPNGKWVYLMEELSSTVVFNQYKNGKLKKVQRINALPDNYTGLKSSADIHVSPDGKFLYCSNRGDSNTISIFSINSKGHLTLIGIQPTYGITPRNFSIAPGGKYMLVANQNSDDITIFSIDKSTGKLQDTGKKLLVPAPVCLKWIKAKS